MSYIIVEFSCAPCGRRFESLENRPPPDAAPCPSCGESSERVISAPKHKTVWASAVTTAKSDPPPSPYYMDTRPLAEGMPLAEWKEKRRKMWAEKDRADLKAKTGI